MSPDDGLRPLFRKNIKRAHWQTIERLLDRGVPDANVCLESVDVWIEFKATKMWHVKIRPEQVGWLLTRSRHGGRTCIAVRRRAKGEDQLWLLAGSVAGILREKGLVPWTTAEPAEGFLGLWHGGPSRWDWDAVRSALVQLGS